LRISERAPAPPLPGGTASESGSGAVAAELFCFVGELVAWEDEEARLAEELTGAPGNDPRGAIHTIIGIPFVLIEVFFVVFQGGTRGALLEEHVEWLLDVVRVQLLVEVDDVVVFFLGRLRDHRVVGDDGHRDLGHDVDVVVEDVDVVVIVTRDEIVVFHEVVDVEVVVLDLYVFCVFEFVIAQRGLSERLKGRGI
jgi:hypothetical protein